MHTQEPGNLGRLLVLADELAGVCDLLGRQGRGAAEPNALRLRRRAAGARALMDQAALELGNAGEESQHHAPGRRRRVGPRLGQRSQAGLGLADPLGNIEKIARRSGEAIEPRHRHHVARPSRPEAAILARLKNVVGTRRMALTADLAGNDVPLL